MDNILLPKPRLPAKAVTHFMFYQREVLCYEAERNSISSEMLARIIDRMWEELPPYERAIWIEIANGDQRRYQAELRNRDLGILPASATEVCRQSEVVNTVASSLFSMRSGSSRIWCPAPPIIDNDPPPFVPLEMINPEVVAVNHPTLLVFHEQQKSIWKVHNLLNNRSGILQATYISEKYHNEKLEAAVRQVESALDRVMCVMKSFNINSYEVLVDIVQKAEGNYNNNPLVVELKKKFTVAHLSLLKTTLRNYVQILTTTLDTIGGSNQMLQ